MLRKILVLILAVSMLLGVAGCQASTAGEESGAWLIGEKAPESNDGSKGDIYLDTSTLDIYLKNADKWKKIGNIQSNNENNEAGKIPVFQMNGQELQWKYENDAEWITLYTFESETAELSWLVGSKTPDASYGNTGDMYINTRTYDIYQKSGSSWNLVCNIKNNSTTTTIISNSEKGEKGEDGEDGKTPVFQMNGKKLQWKYTDEDTYKDLIEIISGEDGEDGSIWFTGSGAPGSGIVAKAGDLYLDSSTSNVYKYSGSSWSLEANIKGAAGADGADGQDGEDGEDGEDGQDGEDGEDGEDGKTPEFRMNNRMLQWKYTDDEDWIDLIEIGNGSDSVVLKAKPVIFDTDFWTDTDDLSAIRILLWAEQEGMCDIVGMIVDTVNSNSAKAISRYLDYEGRGDLPVALEKAANDTGGSPCYFDLMISGWKYGKYSSNDDAEDENAGEYYIKLLNNVPEGEKANIICVGYMTALAGLMNRAEADESVMNLVKEKVDKIYIMAGNYPSGSENNITRSARSKQAGYDAISKIPECIDVIFLGYEAGVSVKSGNKTGSDIGDFDLLYKAMVAHGNGTNANSSWDPMLTLLAVYDDADAAGYELVRGTNTVTLSSGANSFTENEDGHHYYVKKKYPDGWYVHAIDSILAKNAWPHRQTGRVQYNPAEEEFTLTGITVVSTPTKTNYYVGETFSTSGMKVSASLTGDTTGNVKNEKVYSYTVSQTTPFASAGQKTITVSYTHGSVTKTADIYVTVVEPSTFDVTINNTHGTNTVLATITQGQEEEITITPDNGYDLPDSVTVTGATYSYDSTTGKITLSEPTGNVTVTISCVALVERTITVTVTNGSYSGVSTFTKTADITITPSSGRELPTNISVTGATYTWNKTTGVISLSKPTADVVISVSCPVESNDSYIVVELNGTENWAFNKDGEPNSYGFYNCYLIDSTIVPASNTVSSTGSDVYCSWGTDWKLSGGEMRGNTNAKCFGYFASDPSIYFRFDSSIATSVETFKQYLAAHPVTMYFLKAGKTAKTYTISGTITNGSISGDTSIKKYGSASVTLTPSNGYDLPESITVSGAGYSYNKTTGVITLTTPISDVTITATCPQAQTVERTITTNVTNGSASGPNKATGTATVTITPTSGYTLPSTISVTGSTYTWNSSTGVVSLTGITADVTITVVCQDQYSDYIAVVLDGDENWQFNANGEPNNNGYYNIYLIDSSIVPTATALSVNSNFRSADAFCSNTYWTNQTDSVGRDTQNSVVFGYYSKDPSIYFRFKKDITGYATEVDSVADFKAYLQANPLTVYFKKKAS